ncbi:B3 domain-containing protein REM10 [Acorus calamus]|uniref:B3 domain-containing protein REM10 n=1 Tax=Acorus calamus TaxID=4465 RepID=A0AAV9D6F9_ACOCL|nr:B3 domain-containing protein REM10 [Acorus calamus]
MGPPEQLTPFQSQGSGSDWPRGEREVERLGMASNLDGGRSAEMVGKAEGGARVLNLADMYRALLCKWLWRWINGDDLLWRNVIRDRYGEKRWGRWIFPRTSRCSSPIWRGAWVDGVPLKLSYSRLFEAATNRESLISTYWMGNREEGHWRISFARLLSKEEMVDSERLAALLQRLRLNVEASDTPLWIPSSDGSFSVKGCYGWWRRNKEPLPWASMAKETWTPKVPLKVDTQPGSISDINTLCKKHLEFDEDELIPTTMDFISSTNPLFFKVLVHGFHKKLSIPPIFVKKHLAHLSSSKSIATIKSPLGRSWNVNANVKEKGCFFEDGWRVFVRDHDLRVSDFLVFEYKGRLNFSVKLFNGSGCEKEYKSGTKVDVPPTTSPNGCTKQGSSDNECKITSKKRTTESTPPRNGIETKAIYQQNGNSFFEATIKLSNLSYSYMQIPCKFAAMNGFQEKGEIMVRDPAGREWQLKISHCGKLKSETSLSGEWLNLAKVNGLEVGDVCVFEFNPHLDIMNVRIAKKNSILNCCKKEATEECSTENEIEKQFPIGCTRQGSSDDECKLNLRTTEHHRTRNAKEVKDIHHRDGISFFEATINLTNISRPYMSIPGELTKSNGLKDGSHMMLRDPKGRSWEVQMNHKLRSKNWSQLLGQWHQFVVANGLQTGDICVFKLRADGDEDILDVLILKGQSVKKEFSPVQNGSEDCPTQSEAGMPSGSISMYIPTEFAASNGFQNRNKITLRDPRGRLWEMQIFNRFYRNESHFNGMWRQFVRDNGLEVGDTCLLKHVSDGEEIMDVRIIKNQPGPSSKSTTNCKIEGTLSPSTEHTNTSNQGKRDENFKEVLQSPASEDIPSLISVYELLNNTPDIPKYSPEYFHAISKFTNEAHRQAFVLLGDPETRALWIKHDFGFTHNA